MRNNIKHVRINGEVMKVISEAIRYSKDPRISPMTSVMEVDVAADLKTCKVWVSVLGDDRARQKTMEGLESAKGYIRSTVAKEINLRNTPELTFIMDDSIEYAIIMSKKIDEVTKKDNEAIEERREREGDEDADDSDSEE